MAESQQPQTVADVVRQAREASVTQPENKTVAAPTDAAAAAAAATVSTEGAATADAKAAGGPKDTQVFKAIGVDEHGVIALIGAAAEIVDRDNDQLGQRDMVTMAYDFTAKSDRVLKANHTTVLENAQLVASFCGAPILKSGRVLKLGEELPPASEDPVVGMNIEKGKETHWFIEIRPNDPEIVEAAKAGEIVGASWGGWCKRTPVAE